MKPTCTWSQFCMSMTSIWSTMRSSIEDRKSESFLERISLVKRHALMKRGRAHFSFSILVRSPSGLATMMSQL